MKEAGNFSERQQIEIQQWKGHSLRLRRARLQLGARNGR
jgi:hypothetical protein